VHVVGVVRKLRLPGTWKVGFSLLCVLVDLVSVCDSWCTVGLPLIGPQHIVVRC
jgi:hypothetical protein